MWLKSFRVSGKTLVVKLLHNLLRSWGAVFVILCRLQLDSFSTILVSQKAKTQLNLWRRRSCCIEATTLLVLTLPPLTFPNVDTECRSWEFGDDDEMDDDPDLGMRLGEHGDPANALFGTSYGSEWKRAHVLRFFIWNPEVLSKRCGNLSSNRRRRNIERSIEGSLSRRQLKVATVA